MGRHSKSLAYALQRLSDEKYRPYIQAIYLYGSCARGDYKYNSDVDLFLALEPDVPRKLIREMKCAVVPEEIGLPEVELKTGTLESLRSNRQFERNIQREGRLLWERD